MLNVAKSFQVYRRSNTRFMLNSHLPTIGKLWIAIPLYRAPLMVGPRLRECCRQVEAEMVSRSRNKVHQTCGPPISGALYMYLCYGLSNYVRHPVILHVLNWFCYSDLIKALKLWEKNGTRVALCKLHRPFLVTAAFGLEKPVSTEMHSTMVDWVWPQGTLSTIMLYGSKASRCKIRTTGPIGYSDIDYMDTVQSNPLNGSALGPAKKWTNKRIEPLSDSDLLWDHHKMRPAKSRNHQLLNGLNDYTMIH